ncbi:hypothetical protein BGZ83_004111 [Gryganskiella cystojenkinii]|nr:hypothetical protein BGZ83_004111 [Gryganskiella cystojenkinii]
MLTIPRRRATLVAIIVLVTIGLAVPMGFLKLEWSSQDLRSSSSSSSPYSLIYMTDAQRRAEHRTMLSHVTASGTKYTGFVYKSCAETFSFGYTWFTNYFNVVCDTGDLSPRCTLRIENSKGYDNLGEKSLNLWKMVHTSDEAEEIIVKLDDDTMIQKHVLDEFIDKFAKNKKCILAGMVGRWEDTFFWPLGRLYMYKKRALPPAGHIRWENATTFNKWEDGQIGYLIGTTEQSTVCDFGDDALERFAHAELKSDRVDIKFKFLSATCDQNKKPDA